VDVGHKGSQLTRGITGNKAIIQFSVSSTLHQKLSIEKANYGRGLQMLFLFQVSIAK